MAEDPSQEKKTPMTDEERLALCQKLDQELDDFIDSLERKRYTEGWPEDRWEVRLSKLKYFQFKLSVSVPYVYTFLSKVVQFLNGI